MKLVEFFIIVQLFLVLCCKSNSKNILGLFPLKLKSHNLMFDSIMKELARRGHNVTVVTGFPKSVPIPNFTDIDVSDCDRTPVNLFDMDKAYRSHDPFFQLYIFMELAKNDEAILRCPTLSKLFHSKDSYDLVITEIFNSDVMLGFVKQFGAPYISFCASPIFPWAADRMGNPDNPAYITYQHSSVILDLKGSTFYQRLFNTVIYIFAKIKYYLVNLESERMKRKFFNFTSPSLDEISRNTSLILSFSHFSTNERQPLVPNVIQVAGLQIVKTSPLPKDIEKFINESEHGVIYFNMGSLLKSETMPEAKRNAFLNVFSKVPQRVLWKWGNDTLPGKTDNIFISKWFPQRDILAHPNIKLFISHGGALGVNEAVYEGVPILGIPIFADQTLNLKTIQSYGAAEVLEYSDINEKTVLSKIELFLKSNEYSKNMKKLSEIYRDRPISAMDTAIYWIEYVIRYKGAPHLRSAAVNLPFYQYLLLDVIGFCTLILITLIVTIYYSLKMLIKFTCGKLKPKRIDFKKKNK